MTSYTPILIDLLLVLSFCAVAALFFFVLGLAWRVWRSVLVAPRQAGAVSASRKQRAERAQVGEVKT